MCGSTEFLSQWKGANYKNIYILPNPDKLSYTYVYQNTTVHREERFIFVSVNMKKKKSYLLQ